jgi:hypothetical protein
VVSQLNASGLIGWLVVTEGVYYQPRHKMDIMMVRPLTSGGDWETAKLAFLSRRAVALAK